MWTHLLHRYVSHTEPKTSEHVRSAIFGTGSGQVWLSCLSGHVRDVFDTVSGPVILSKLKRYE